MTATSASPPRRNFSPAMTARYGRPTFTPEKLVKYSPKWKYARLMNFPFRGSHWRPRMHTIVIAIDGRSRGNDRSKSESRAGWGVYFGPNCHRNAYGTIDAAMLQTNNRTELEALRQALIIVEEMHDSGEFDGYYREIIIKTDAVYVAKSMSECIWKWVKSGGIGYQGKVVAHWEMIKQMHDKISHFEENCKINVRFWTVRREDNKDADRLVNIALETGPRNREDCGYQSE